MKARTWIAFASGLLVSLAAAYGAYTLANDSWNEVVEYRGPYVAETLPAARAGSVPPSTRVVLITVDGLREDVSRRMETLQRLRERGFDTVVRTGQPALSFPNWTTLLSGAPQRISGVTTNWYEGRVRVETLVDVAVAEGRTMVVSGPTDFEALYGVRRTGHVFLKDWVEDSYMSTEIVDRAIALSKEASPSIVLVHLPDIDEAGHGFGGASPEYLATSKKVDADIKRLVEAFQDDRTVFVVASDHGHIDTGGHGGWEPVVVDVPAVFAGAGVRFGTGKGEQSQIAPTVALLAGLPAPRNAIGAPLPVAVSPGGLERFDDQRAAALAAYTRAVEQGTSTGPTQVTRAASAAEAGAAFDAATARREASERAGRLPIAAGLALACVLVIATVGVLSWRALVAASIGALAYYGVYNGLFFLAHGYSWSLSAFNSESLLKAFFNGRMVEAVVGGVVAAAVAADVYLMLRRPARRPRGQYLPGWLGLGVAAVLVVQATLGLQVAWYLWRWGVPVTWVLPDFMWAFKYDLDLIQATALGAAALLAPAVTYLVGRFHPLPASREEA